MSLTLSKVLSITPAAAEVNKVERTYADPGVLDSTILVYYNGAAINTYPNTVDQSYIKEKYYALYRITATEITIFIMAKQGFRAPKYSPGTPTINMSFSPFDKITVSYQYVR